MAQTAGGTYYAASSELVSSWPATSLDLANQLESRFAAKANLASPTFTGTPAAPTAANGTNSTQIATTAFVLANAPASGLTLISSQALSGSAVSFNNVFTTTYANYLITLENVLVTSGSDVNCSLRLRASSSDNTNSSYSVGRQYVTDIGTGATNIATTTQFSFVTWLDSTNPSAALIDVLNPQEAKYTNLYGRARAFNAGGYIVGRFQATTQFDGFTVYPASSTFSAGTCRVYGLKN